MLILDVGCGANPRGHVNLDTMKGWDDSQIKPTKIKNFIIADGMHLPFKKKAFDLITCIMTLEHFIDPANAIRNFIYVSDRAYFVVPNNPIVKDAPTHLFSWSQESFQNFLKLFYSEIIITTGTQEIQSIDSIFIKILNKIPIFRFVVMRIISRFFPLRIFASCKNPLI